MPPLENFDAFFDTKNVMNLQNPLSIHLEHTPPTHNIGTDSQNLYQQGRFPTDGEVPFDRVDASNFGVPSTDELFANNLGFAFSPDCLPSDYNMFDTLNQMYLEETW